MIIYIHGFGSSGQGGKAELFRKYFKKQNIPFIAPSLSFVPDLAIYTLEELIGSYDNVSLIGSSLGGFYSIYLSKKFNIKAVLINPAIESEKTLKRHIFLKEYATNYYDGSSFVWRETHLDMLKKLSIETPKEENLLLLLQKGDEILDYKDALKKLPNTKTIIEDGGNHSFEGIDRYLDNVKNFINN